MQVNFVCVLIKSKFSSAFVRKANKKIEKGALILREKPLITWRILRTGKRQKNAILFEGLPQRLLKIKNLAQS